MINSKNKFWIIGYDENANHPFQNITELFRIQSCNNESDSLSIFKLTSVKDSVNKPTCKKC